MKIIGIDLGTTNSVICEYRRGDVEVIKVEGGQTVPSVVYLKDGTPQVGKLAKNRLLIDPAHCLSSTKRDIGSGWTQEIDGKTYSPVDVATMILSHLKSQIEGVEQVVITIPAYFEDKQREQTLLAAENAGLKVLRLLNEPTAAAIRYGLDKEKDQTILVVDLGGGTFDVTVLEVKDNDFNVLATDGNDKLGGDDFDLAIVAYLNEFIEEHHGESVRDNSVTQQKLKEEAERVKIALASAKSEGIFLAEVAPGINIDIDKFTRNDFKGLIQPHLDEVVEKTHNVISQSGITKDEINRFVLVGGSCKHPLVQEAIEENFKTPYLSDNMDTCVAEGAAIVCANLMMLDESGTSGDIPKDDLDLLPNVKFQDVIPHSLGIAMRGDWSFSGNNLIFIPILEKNSNYPCREVVFGYADEGQELVEFRVYRGESKNPVDNTYLGILESHVPKEYIGEVVMAFVNIFELDGNGVLTFRNIEIPMIAPYKDVVQEITQDVTTEEMKVSIDKVSDLISRHDLKTQVIKIETK